MDRKHSELVLKVAFDASSILERASVLLQSSVSEDEHRTLRLAIGTVLTQIGEELIEPVFESHPELKPSDTDEEWAGLRRRVDARPWEGWP